MTSLTIEDAESSFLKGKAMFNEWKDEFELHWNAPQAIDALGILVNTMPMEGRMMAPDATAIMERIYRKMRGG